MWIGWCFLLCLMFNFNVDLFSSSCGFVFVQFEVFFFEPTMGICGQLSSVGFPYIVWCVQRCLFLFDAFNNACLFDAFNDAFFVWCVQRCLFVWYVQRCLFCLMRSTMLFCLIWDVAFLFDLQCGVRSCLFMTGANWCFF